MNVLVDSGTISQAEAKIHPQKNILLQAVGVSDALNPSFIQTQLDDGMILVCSDGLYNSLSFIRVQLLLLAYQHLIAMIRLITQ